MKVCRILLFFVVGTLISSGCFGFDFYNVSPNIGVHFNDPEGLTNKNNPPLDIIFSNFLGQFSNTEIYLAFYDIDVTTFSYAVNSSLSRGCTVFMFCDADAVSSGTTAYNLINTPYKARISQGNEVHNKFCVIKDSVVWTGSWNATVNDTYKNNNNIVIFRSTGIASVYEKEFQNMYAPAVNRYLFGTAKSTSTSAQAASGWNGKTHLVDGVPVTVFFSPYSLPRTNTAIVNRLEKAKDGVYFCMFTFSNLTGIDDTLISLYGAGKKVYGVIEQVYSSYYRMKTAGINITVDGNPDNLHSKFCVIDPYTSGAAVLTGSHNWTEPANTQNDENMVIIETPTVAGLYYREFLKLYGYAVGLSTGTVRSKSALSGLSSYPSPARNHAKIGFSVGDNVNSLKLRIFTLTASLVRETEITYFSSGFYNEYNWNLKNDTGENVADGIYLVSVIADTPDGKIVKNTKLAVER